MVLQHTLKLKSRYWSSSTVPAQAEEICAFAAGVKGVPNLSPLLKQDPYIYRDLLYLPLEYLEQNNLFLSAEL